jgi:transcriptional regulator with XRE-family HTH domain
MNFLGANIKFLRKQKELTQEKLASKIGVKRALIGAYEEERAEPKLRTMFTICHYFNVTIDDLVNTDLSAQKENTTTIDMKGEKLRILPITVDQTERELCTIVPVKASAGYMKGYGDIDYIEALPKFPLPFPELPKDRTYRLFQISGDSMLPVLPKSYIICEYVDDWHNIKNEECYVLITHYEGIVYKRVINNLNEKELILKSDNTEYKPYKIQATEIIEVWKALGYTSFELPDTQQVPLNAQQLTETIIQLKDDVDFLKQRFMKDE